MTRPELIVAFLTLAVTVIGAAFWLGATMATETDVAEFRDDMSALREGLNRMVAESILHDPGRDIDTLRDELHRRLDDHLNEHPGDDN